MPSPLGIRAVRISFLDAGKRRIDYFCDDERRHYVTRLVRTTTESQTILVIAPVRMTITKTETRVHGCH